MAQAALVAPPASDPSLPDRFLMQRLMHVREQLSRLDAMLMEEMDPQKLDRLASASSKLSTVERELAGRPSPGAYRPSTPRRRPVGMVPLVPE